ncbi:MAG: penicillin-binding protein 2 [Gammaproteobacteria bacterium]|nr:penicillin-binding protein 2 [Gammaproteobacteria bacterium]
MTDDKKKQPSIKTSRCLFIAFGFTLGAALLMWRAVDLQLLNNEFYQGQGNARYLRVVDIAAHRGMITDRHGEPLAISTPVSAIWANPQELVKVPERIAELAQVLDLNAGDLLSQVNKNAAREFIYIKRRIEPSVAEQVKRMKIPGVAAQREYRRYYPEGETSVHVSGFTDVDDVGQEGIELAYDEWLRGSKGRKRVIKDRLGRIVESVERIREPVAGKNLTLSIDKRLQYLAYRELKTAVIKHRAQSGSVVILDAKSGEILAMVNEPASNPNKRVTLRADSIRNRAVTDAIEPGSTIKPFTVAAALESGKYTPSSEIDTSPGWYTIGRKRHVISDIKNYGRIDVGEVIRKSSNVGVSKIALSLEPEQMRQVFSAVGFGEITDTGFPGESPGLLSGAWSWHDVERATLAYGYGLSVTALQLARAYAVLADGGRIKPVSFLRLEQPPHGEQVLSEQTARQVRVMLEKVVGPGGTGTRARVPGYRVAGKTGTARKSVQGGYVEQYVSLFAGMAPASDPRLVMVVIINEPGAGGYFGGVVAAPVFSHVMGGALRMLDVAPDDLASLAAASQAGSSIDGGAASRRSPM